MPRIIRSPLAKADIVEIWAYIAEDNPAAADRLIDRFGDIFQRILDQPMMGKSTDELGEGLRFFPTGSYLIFYRCVGGDIEIARVLHGARDVSAEFFAE